MEVRARELEGRSLLGLVAAERGHEVLLGELDDLLSHRHWLPPGIFHDTTLTPAPYRLTHHDLLARAGFRITSQDEEHGLTETSMDAFVAKRYADATLATASAAFTWGPTDTAAVQAAHPLHTGRVIATGSPRVDLWRPDLADFYRDLPLPGVPDGRDYVLISTNLAPAAANRFWVQMRDLRPVAFEGEDDPAEFAIYARAAREHAQAGQLVRAIRRLARSRPDLLVVVRPHPMEADGAWEDLIGPIDNVLVTRFEGIGRWIRRAVALVHVRSTSAYEAAIAGVPVISFLSEDDPADLAVDGIGAVARSAEELEALVDQAREPAARAAWFDASHTTLEASFAAIDGPLAADRIVDAWEHLDPPDGRALRRPRLARRQGQLHRLVGSVRTRLRSLPGGGTPVPRGGRFETAHKFPALDRTVLDAVVASHRDALSRFDRVRIKLIGPRLIHLRG
jgi:surface carbohydrate biosynthesis protein